VFCCPDDEKIIFVLSNGAHVLCRAGVQMLCGAVQVLCKNLCRALLRCFDAVPVVRNAL
jgi:hypothetical protein